MTPEIKPIKPANQVEKIDKNADGSMTCYQKSGNVFTIPASEKEMQVFVVWSILNKGF